MFSFAPNLYFVCEFLRAGEVAERDHFLDGDLALRGELVLAQELAAIGLGLAFAGEEHDRLHRLREDCRAPPSSVR